MHTAQQTKKQVQYRNLGYLDYRKLIRVNGPRTGLSSPIVNNSRFYSFHFTPNYSTAIYHQRTHRAIINNSGALS